MAAAGLITADIALNMQKNKRKTFGFGTYYKKDRRWDVEIHIRELSIGEAGLGCALWDASIIISRLLYSKRDILAGRKILEVGSGCGLPAILAGMFAREVVASDYIAKTVENLQYNIKVNAEAEDDDELNEEEQAARRVLRDNLHASTQGVVLDWDEETDDNAQYQLGFQSFDMIMGTELVYTPNKHHHESLKNVILRYLKPEGIVWFCQSDNRLDMPQFLELMESIGFEVTKTVVPEEFLGNYQSRQVFETYKFYSFRRATTDPSWPNL